MFYFAAASYAEMARRVAPARPGAGFLRAADPLFAAAMRACSPATGDTASLNSRIAHAVEAINIAGLCATEKRNWYPADAADAIAGASKLGVTAGDVTAALEAAGFS